jgi:NADPH-dependent 2,4-dienoyl-CoA reductase/sulfur reductase-like enzyme
MPKSQGKRVVIIGGGFGGLSAAKYISKKDPTIEVVVIEKRDVFIPSPLSNALLGGVAEVSFDTLIRDLDAAANTHGYHLHHANVSDINRRTKTVITNRGVIDYDILLLSPGMTYDYKRQFPQWSDEKIATIKQGAPGALMHESEFLLLQAMLKNRKGGNVLITKPQGKFRCPTVPFERACMIASYMKKNDLPGKVIILNSGRGVAMGAAFRETWRELYADKIEHREACSVTDIDLESRTVFYNKTLGMDSESNPLVEQQTEHFEVLNFIPKNRASFVVEMAGLECNDWGGVLMNAKSFRSKTDPYIYAIGDVVAHEIPPTAQSANWSAKEAANEIVAKINHTQAYILNLPYAGASVCYARVSDTEAIRIRHDFTYNGRVIRAKGHLSHLEEAQGKYRSKAMAKAREEWLKGILDDMFV